MPRHYQTTQNKIIVFQKNNKRFRKENKEPNCNYLKLSSFAEMSENLEGKRGEIAKLKGQNSKLQRNPMSRSGMKIEDDVRGMREKLWPKTGKI